MNIKECPGKFAGGPVRIEEQDRRRLVADDPEAIEIEISADVDEVPKCGARFAWLAPGDRTGVMRVVSVRRTSDGNPLGRIVRLTSEPVYDPPSEPPKRDEFTDDE